MTENDDRGSDSKCPSWELSGVMKCSKKDLKSTAITSTERWVMSQDLCSESNSILNIFINNEEKGDSIKTIKYVMDFPVFSFSLLELS